MKGSAKGFSIIEVMVALGLLALVIASSAKVIILSMHANKATRTYASVVADVQEIVDNLRGQSFSETLSLFGGNFSAISNGETYTTTVDAPRSRASYNVTLTALKSTSNSSPEAVQVQVTAEHRRGAFQEASYEFTTLISAAR